MKGKTVLTIVHGHPDYSPGGGEIAAHTLFKAYGQLPQVTKSVFLATQAGEAAGRILRHARNEYLWRHGCHDYFYMQGERRYNELAKFSEFLQAVNPDLVHMHHGIHLGYELLDLIRHQIPRCRIFFTLHEFIPMCLRDGHMIRQDGSPCHLPSPHLCHHCNPDYSPEKFWLRERRMRHFLSVPDMLLAPSEFLRQRYISWGIAPERITMLENALRPLSLLPARPLTSDSPGRNRFAFFGQIHYTKGLQLLLDALLLMTPEQRGRIRLEIHGAKLEEQHEFYQQEIKRRLNPLAREGCVRLAGPYAREDLPQRMAGVDWVCIPSLWWENSPVVIQEAFALGRPVLAADMGGMAEKVADGVDGLHVAARNPLAWSDALLHCANNDELWRKLHGGIKRPVDPEQTALFHWRLMESLG